MKTPRPFKHLATAGLGAVLVASSAAALADPPARIARLAYVNGAVSFAPAGENTWEYATINRTLIPGDRLWVEPGARDEVQLGGAALRMGGGTLVSLLSLDDRTTQLQLSQGRLNVRVRQLRPNEVFEIDTPNLALSIRQPGDYRVEVDPSGNATMVAVRSGAAEAYGEGNAYRLAGGEAFSFAGTDLRDARYARVTPDEFDGWAAARERRFSHARSARYVSPNLIGYEDLDEQGAWRVVPDYGNVWMPANVGRDWAPYRDGHWSYVQPWGWTWVDDAPWGFAVSHYGRWARLPDGWGWVPGPRAATPLYAPALVAFVSIGDGAYSRRERPVAWFPLAPREVYRPSYRASPTYVTNINITNTTLSRGQVGRDDRHTSYANRRVGGAVTAVPATAFVRSQPVSRAALAVPMAALAAAPVGHAAPVAPERGAAHGRAGRQPPPAVMARQALARNAPPAFTRGAPAPAAQAPLAVLPAPRVLRQDRHGAGRELRPVPVQQAFAGQVGTQDTRRVAPSAMPQQAAQPDRDRFAGPAQGGRRGQRDAAPAPGQAGMPPAPAAAPQAHGRDRMAPPLAHAPTPVAPQIDQQGAAQQQAAERQRGQQAEGRQRREQQQAAPQHAAEDQQRAQQRAAAEQQRNQQQGAEQQRNQQQAEGRQRREQQVAQQQQQQQQRAADDQQHARQRAAAEQQRNQQQAEGRQRREQQAAEQQQRATQDQQHAQQRAAAEQQRNQQQVQERQRREQQAAQQQQQQRAAQDQQHAQQRAAAEQQRNQQQAQERQRHDQQQAAQQQAAQQRAAQQQAAQHQQQQQREQQAAAQQQQRAAAEQQRVQQQAAPPPQGGHGNEGKKEKEDKRHGDHPDKG